MAILILGAYALRRSDPTVVIGQEEFKAMKESINTAKINRDATGLDDFMIKKMLLAYYRSVYFSDTNLLIEITEDEKKDGDEEPFKIISGDKDNGLGEDDKYYLQTKGIVTIYNASDKELVYYPKDALQKIYDIDYIGKINDNPNFANSVMDYLKRCYTLSDDGGIEIYSFNTEKIEEVYEYADQGIKSTKENNNGQAKLTKVDYNTSISQFGTPVEFLVDLMEITGSKEFVNSVIKLANEENHIKLGLYETKSVFEETINTEYNQNTKVTGKKLDVTYEVKDSDNNVIPHTEEKIDGEDEKINIKITANKDGNYSLYKNGKIVTKYVTSYGETPDYVFLKSGESGGWNNQTKPSQAEKAKEDLGKITVKTIKTTEENRYDIAVKSINTWYAKITQENTSNTVNSYYTVNENNEQISIDSPYNVLKSYGELEKLEYNSQDNDTMFNTDYKKETSEGETSFINSIYNYTIRKKEDNYSYNDYEFSNIEIEKSNITKSQLYERKSTSVTNGIPKGTYDVDKFIALLKNNSGEKIRYKDFYKGTTGVGEMLVNGDQMLFQLLDSSPNTQGLSDVMKYILYKYTGRSYGVEEWDFYAFDMQNSSGGVGINVNTINISKEEFVKCVREFRNDAGYQERFAKYAEKIYDICKSKNINPVLCVAQAGQESNFGASVPSNSKWNYWGLAVYNDQSTGKEFNNIDEAITFYCDTILGYQKEGSIAYNKAKLYAPYNDKITGNMNSIYDIFSAYMFLGNYHNGKIWGNVNVKKYLTEYMNFPCSHSESEATTLEEQAAYVVDYIDNHMIKIAKQIFGESIMNNSDFYGGTEIYNSNGSVNEDKIKELDNYLTRTILNTTHHWRTYANQSGPFAKWWDPSNNPLEAFQCTWWTNGRASQFLELNGTKYKKYPTAYGNGGDYYDVNKNNGYFNYGMTPKKNSIISWKSGSYGHVAYVEAVDANGDIWISHAGSGQSWFGISKVTKQSGYAPSSGSGPWSGYTLNGFIYLSEPK